MPVNKTLLARAQSAVISRDFETATRLYNEMIQDSPDDIELLRQLGNLHVKNNKDSEALPIFTRITELSSKDVDALISIGGIYRRQKKFNESIAVLERALATGTNNTQVSYNLGFTFRQMKMYDEAISCFEDVVDQNPNDVLAFNHIGAIYAERNQHESAISTYLRGLKTDPNHPILQMNLAKSYEAIGTNSKAVAAYAAALKAKPGWLECIDHYSKLLLKLNRVRDAYELINGALRLNAEDTKMHTRMGDVYMKQSIYPDAEKEYKEALTYDESYIPALEGLVDSQGEQGKTEEAVQTIQKIEKLDPENPTVLQKSASIYLDANYLSAAYEKIMQLMDSSSRDVQTLSLLGQYYISNGEWEQAEETLQKIIEIEPTYSEFYRSGAKRLIQAGKTDEAEKYLQKAISVNPHDSAALSQLGNLYEQDQQLEKAYDAYRKASAVDANNQTTKKALLRIRKVNPELGTYDPLPSLEMENAEIHDEVIQPKPIIPQGNSAEPEMPMETVETEGQDEPQAQAIPPREELAPQNAELIEEIELPEEEPQIMFEPEDEPFDFTGIHSEQTEVEAPKQEEPTIVPEDGLEELREDASEGTRLFEDDSMFATPEEPAQEESLEDSGEPVLPDTQNNWEPQEKRDANSSRFAEPVDEDGDDEEDEEDAIPEALSAALDKITAQADKAALAAEDAWRAAKKAAGYAQAAEDAVAAAEEAAEREPIPEAVTEEFGSEPLLPQSVEAVEDTEGDEPVSDDDLVNMSVPILPLPEETTEVSDSDIDSIEVPILDLPDETTEVTESDIDSIEVPVLSPTDSVDTATPSPAQEITELSSPSILDMVKTDAEQVTPEASLSLFKALREMTRDLPQNKQDIFRESRMSTVLDSIIAQLEK